MNYEDFDILGGGKTPWGAIVLGLVITLIIILAAFL
jgi:hypothetical protein